MDFPANLQEVPWLDQAPEEKERQTGLRLFRAWVAPGTMDQSATEEAFAIHAPAEDGKKALDLAMALEISPNLTVRYQKNIKFWGQTVLESKVDIDAANPIELDCTFTLSFESADELFSVSGDKTVSELAFEVLLPTVRAVSMEMIAFASTMLQAKERK